MNQNKIQELLDSMLFPINEVKENRNANESLSQAQKEFLWGIINDFETYQKTYDYKKALEQIAVLMKPYENQTETVMFQDGTERKIPVRVKAMPYLIKQVLFYIVVMCKRYHKVKQKEILRILSENNINVSHNFFSGNLPVTPNQYIQMIEHRQFDYPIKYKGKKDGKLGVAIKHLAYQAGKYNTFVDIFGGSGAATIAVSKRKEVTYIYNEKNKMLYNLIAVISDEKMYLELISALESLKVDLKGDGEWLEDIDFDEEIETYYYSKKSNDRKEEIIVFDNSSDMDVELSDTISYMKEIQKDLLEESEDFTLFFEGEDYTKQWLLETLFIDFGPAYMKDFGLFMSFIYNFRLIHYYAGKKMDLIQGEVYKSRKNTTEYVNLTRRLKEFQQYRFYKYYAYFFNLLRKEQKTDLEGQQVLYAVAELYIQFFRCNGEPGVSPILRMLWIQEENNSVSKDWERFLSQDFSKAIKQLHIALERVKIENKEYYEIMSMFQNKKTLFYSDSPYIVTSDYKDEVNGVTAFTSLDMQRLIDGLFGNSFETTTIREKVLKEKKLTIQSNNKFIFSCRAVKTFKTGSRKKKKLQEENQIILDYVFGTFLDYIIQCNGTLYVLVIEMKEKTLADFIKQDKVAEVMITNFEIFSFSDKSVDKKTRFVVYSFEEFWKILINNTDRKIEKEGITEFFVN